MTEYRTKSGRVLTEADIEALADEAEKGYDVSHLKPSPAVLHKEEGDEHLHLPVNKPRHVVFADEAIGKLIKVARLIKFQIDTPEEAEPTITVVLKDPNDAGMKTFKGKGPTIGHALRQMLDNVNIDYPLGEEYYEDVRE